jgi:hypothetical protein
MNMPILCLGFLRNNPNKQKGDDMIDWRECDPILVESDAARKRMVEILEICSPIFDSKPLSDDFLEGLGLSRLSLQVNPGIRHCYKCGWPMKSNKRDICQKCDQVLGT